MYLSIEARKYPTMSTFIRALARLLTGGGTGEIENTVILNFEKICENN